MKKTVILITSLALILSLFSCNPTMDEIKESETTKKLEETTIEDTSKQSTTSQEDEFTPKDGENYKVKLVSKFKDVKIEPVYSAFDRELYPLGVSYISSDDSLSLIDYEGNIRAVCEDTDFSFCGICTEISNHEYYIDPQTVESVHRPSGHGGTTPNVYCYTENTKEIYDTGDYGYMKLVTEPIAFSVVCLAEIRNSTTEEKDWWGYDQTIDKKYKYSIIINGTITLPFEYDCYEYISDGIIALMKDGKWCYYNAKGEEILDLEYSGSSIERYLSEGNYTTVPHQASYGYISVCRDGKWAYCDYNGTFVTDFEFDYALPVFQGLAWVKIDGVWAIIEFSDYDKGISRKEATELVKERYDVYFNGDRYSSVIFEEVPDDESIGYYLTEGTYTYHFSYEIKEYAYKSSFYVIVLPTGEIAHISER